MSETPEELLHDFYRGNLAALDELSRRFDRLLFGIANLVLQARTGSAVQAMVEWDVADRVANVWTLVELSRRGNLGRWPHQRLSALAWLIYLVCLEMDRHLGLRPPF